VTEIDFYIIDEATSESRLTFACRLADKAVDRGRHVLIRPGTPTEARRLDELLWTFSQSSFVPHRLASSAGGPPIEPVLIDDGPGPVGERWDLLINLADEIPEYFSRYARLAEIVDGSDERRAQGRERYRYYRDRGYPLKTHQIRA
jgi:DNA polymerase III subunit chi